jgi:toxin ParE1/3/4
MKIRLTKAAIRDLREARAYIATDDPEAALKVISMLDKAIALIGEKPQIGRPIQSQSAREWSVPRFPYVIPYRVSDGVIEIIRIYHTSCKRPSEW